MSRRKTLNVQDDGRNIVTYLASVTNQDIPALALDMGVGAVDLARVSQGRIQNLTDYDQDPIWAAIEAYVSRKQGELWAIKECLHQKAIRDRTLRLVQRANVRKY